MNPAEAAQRWADTWRTAWERLDADPIIALYSHDAIFSSQPFRPPYRGREGVASYIRQAFGDEQRPVPRFGTPVVEGDRASVPWWTEVTEAGAEITLAGTSLLRFDDSGLVVSQWDTWNQAAGRSAPPDWLDW